MYFTAGYPRLDDTVSIAGMVEEAGVDFIELGIPFSDPVADGPTIQASNKVALDNGMNLHLLEGVVEGTPDAGLTPRLCPAEGMCCVRLDPADVADRSDATGRSA